MTHPPEVPAPPLRVGLTVATIGDPGTRTLRPARALQAARRAEDAGFDAVYVGDHLVHPHPMLESLVTLAAIAASTERIALGPCVLLLALRHPVLAANQLRTLAAFAGGRLRIGVGVGGEYAAEFAAAGVPPAERGARTDAALARLRAELDDVPIFVGGSSDAALRRAVDLGDGWIGYLLGPASFARRHAALERHRADRGRADRPFTTGMLLPVHLTDRADGRATAAAAWTRLTATASAAPLPERLFVAGPPDQVVAELDAYRRAGCTELVLTPADHGDGHLRQIDRLATDVLPRLRALV
jgi:alkanesulfonate monooxygenase SsuD/methylene tetrahydromethanopterin reductase-like flavin-dependent oxidoreductase (luciferase family)